MKTIPKRTRAKPQAGRIIALVACLTVALAAPAASAAPPERAAATTCKTVVRIAGKRTCLATGKRCSVKYQRTYKSRGYVCSHGRLKRSAQTF